MLTIDHQTDIKEFYHRINQHYPLQQIKQCFTDLDTAWTNFCNAYGLEITSIEHYWTYSCYNTQLVGHYYGHRISLYCNYARLLIEYNTYNTNIPTNFQAIFLACQQFKKTMKNLC